MPRVDRFQAAAAAGGLAILAAWGLGAPTPTIMLAIRLLAAAAIFYHIAKFRGQSGKSAGRIDKRAQGGRRGAPESHSFLTSPIFLIGIAVAVFAALFWINYG